MGPSGRSIFATSLQKFKLTPLGLTMFPKRKKKMIRQEEAESNHSHEPQQAYQNGEDLFANMFANIAQKMVIVREHLPMLAKDGGAFLLFRFLFTQHGADSNDTAIGCLWNVFMIPPLRFFIPRTAVSLLSAPYQVLKKMTKK